MNIVFTPAGWSDYLFWQQQDGTMVARINDLIRDACRSPFRGLGKPEPLRGDLRGFWSRRLTSEHRLVYRVAGTGETQRLEIIACRFHYRQ